LALVGMHVVGTTKEHQEFIWATFEQQDNAPDCANLTNDAPGGAPWNFYNGACTDSTCSAMNQYEQGKNSQVCRINPHGQADAKGLAEPNENSDNIVAINQSMQGLIGASSLPKAWSHYALTGNVWSNHGQLPAYTAQQRGSLASANVSMETYVQNGVADINTAFNCMSCHTVETGTQGAGRDSVATQQPAAAISHLFHAVVKDTGGCTDGKLPNACLVE
jgi:hypothetical protein